MMKRVSLLPVVFLSVVAVSCASNEPEPTPPTLNPVSRQFHTDTARTRKAVLDVLSRNHFEVASQGELISTRWKEVGYSEPRGLFRRTYPIRSRLTVWVKARGKETFVTITNEEVIMLSDTEMEKHATTTEREHELLEQISHAPGAP